MKLNVHFEQCSSGWKMIADLEGLESEPELAAAQALIENAAQFSMGLPGWNGTKDAPEDNEAQNKWRKAYFARKNWARGLGK